MEQIISLFGVQIPTLVAVFLFAGIVQIAINRVLSSLGVYEFVWHPGLFRTALFMCIFTPFSLLIYK